MGDPSVEPVERAQRPAPEEVIPEAPVRFWPIMGAAFLSAGLGATYIGAAYTLLQVALLPDISRMHSHRSLVEIVGLVTFFGICSGVVTGATYAVSGGRLGVVLAGILGGLANPTMPGRFHNIPPVLGYVTDSPMLALFLALSLALPFVFSSGFAWLLYRAGECDSALPMLTPVAREVRATGIVKLSLFARLGAGLLAGAIGVRLMNSPAVQALIEGWQH